MKIIKKTHSQLIFRSRSDLDVWTTWILGFLLSAIELTFLLFRIVAIGGATTFTCQRMSEKNISCQLKKYQFPLSWEITKIPPGDLQSARLERDSGNEGTYHHRPVFVTRSGEIPLRGFYSFGEESQQKKVDRVNNFIGDDKQTSVTVRDIDGPAPFLWFAVDITWLSLSIVCLHSRQINAQFDRELNCFTLKQTNAFGTKFFEHSLSEITDIVGEEGMLDEGMLDGGYTIYNIFIVMASGDRLLLWYGNNFSHKNTEIMNSICEYSNLSSKISGS